MAKLNVKQIKRIVNNRSATQLGGIAFGAALSRFNSRKEKLISQFERHPVTKEIEAGEDAPNISGTLLGRGNLFTFIGFFAGTQPITPIINLLVEKTTLRKVPIVKETQRTVLFSFTVDIPTEEEIQEVSGYPENWKEGSWVRDIEKGIPGLMQFLYFAVSPISRSGGPIQAQHPVRGVEFKPVDYLFSLLKQFRLQFLA